MLNHFKSSDISILRLFNFNLKCKFLDLIMPAITYIGSFQFSLIFCILAFLYPDTSVNKMGMYCTMVLVLSTISVQFLKRSIIRIRPFEIIDNLNVNKIQIDPFSFPSGHTTAAFSLMITAGKFFPPLLPALFIVAVLVGISRMYIGVHYPSDVAVGAIIGILSSVIVNVIF